MRIEPSATTRYSIRGPEILVPARLCCLPLPRKRRIFVNGAAARQRIRIDTERALLPCSQPEPSTGDALVSPSASNCPDLGGHCRMHPFGRGRATSGGLLYRRQCGAERQCSIGHQAGSRFGPGQSNSARSKSSASPLPILDRLNTIILLLWPGRETSLMVWWPLASPKAEYASSPEAPCRLK